MAVNCFSWCRPHTQWGFKKRTTREKLDETLSENQLSLREANYYTSVRNRVIGKKSNEELSENTRTVVPTTTEYITTSGKQVLKLLKSAAGVIPVPLLREALGVALTIIQVCEEASAVEKKIKELQDRVGNLMIVIVAHVTAKNEEGSEAVVKAAKDIEEDIKGLLRTLRTINDDLKEISMQNRWLTAFCQEPNMSTLENCMNQLSIAMEKFKFANDLRNSDLLQELQTRLEKMTNKVDDISKDVKHMVARVDSIDNKLEEFHHILSRLTLGRPASEKVARQQTPLKPEIFHGRDDLVEEIVQWLMNEETSHVCILGPGGMGKTSVSLAVIESCLIQKRFPHRSIVWVPCIGATSATLLLEILYVQLGVPGDKQVTLEKIISEVNTFKDPRLILFDNFETPWNAPGGNQKQVEDILRRLAQLNHVAIFVTIRGNYPPCNSAIKWQSKNIQPTDEESCLRIFHDINPRSMDVPDVSRLLSALGHMPFAVTLMANLAKDGHSSAKDLLDAWSESGPDILSDNPEQSMNRSISLSVDSDLVKRNPNAFLLLAILSLLPAGTTKENLRWWAPTLKESMIPSAVATLSKAALLVQNQQQDSNSLVLSVVPVVQSFMQQHGRIADELRREIHFSCCQYVLDHACRFDDSAFPVKMKALAAEDTNIQSILFGSSVTQHTNSPDITMEACIAFNWHRCDTKPNPEIARISVAAAKAACTERHIASAVWCLGRTYHQISDYCLSYDLLQESCQIFNSLPHDDRKLQRLRGQCATDLVESAYLALQDMDEVVKLALDVEKQCSNLSDDVIHGRSLVLLGVCLNEAKQNQEALHYLDRARTMLKGNPSNLAYASQVIARVHCRERRLPEALDAMQESWKQSEISGTTYIQASISLEFGIILFSANKDSEAWKYIEIALMKATHFGDQHMVADALEYMGYGYLRKGDYRNAYVAYEAAMKKWNSLSDALGDGWDFKLVENMGRIKEKQMNPDKVVGFFRPGLDYDVSLFYPLVQALASASG